MRLTVTKSCHKTIYQSVIERGDKLPNAFNLFLINQSKSDCECLQNACQSVQLPCNQLQLVTECQKQKNNNRKT